MHMTRSKSPARYSYKLCGVTLGEATSNPYLGVQIQADLGWNTHIDYAMGKERHVLGLIKRNFNINNINWKLTLFNTLVRPILEYGACSWDSHIKKNIKKIEVVQRNAARFILCNYERIPGTLTGLLKQLNMVSIEQRRKYLHLQMMYKKVYNKVDIPVEKYLTVAQQRTRGSHCLKYSTYSTCTNVYKYSFFPRTVVDWNCLDEHTVTAPSPDSFKERLKKHEH